ncbi:hypothetical protein Gohar_020786, partial [Gossypium harknessii]|nr:hypothetical protein [Gossypium harknessii]
KVNGEPLPCDYIPDLKSTRINIKNRGRFSARLQEQMINPINARDGNNQIGSQKLLIFEIKDSKSEGKGRSLMHEF